MFRDCARAAYRVVAYAVVSSLCVATVGCASEAAPDASGVELSSSQSALSRDDALRCIADYAEQGACDWAHWSEMVEACEVDGDPRLDGDALLAEVRAGRCTYANWPALYDRLTRASGTAPAPAPITDLTQALNCVAGYIHRGACDWAHWSELYEACKTYEYATLDDDFLLEQVRTGACTWESWPAIFAHATGNEPPASDAPTLTPVEVTPVYVVATAASPLDEALACVGRYASRDACDWAHWSEMYEVCQTYQFRELDDGRLLDAVASGRCSAATFPALEAQLRDGLVFEDDPVVIVDHAPPTLEESVACVATYAARNACDWAHWSELYDVCTTYLHPALDDGYLIDQVATGQCTAASFPSIRAHVLGTAPAPSTGLEQAVHCVAGYAYRGQCDSGHWSELVERCGTLGHAEFDSEFFAAHVQAGECTWAHWSRVYQNLPGVAPVADPETLAFDPELLNRPVTLPSTDAEAERRARAAAQRYASEAPRLAGGGSGGASIVQSGPVQTALADAASHAATWTGQALPSAGRLARNVTQYAESVTQRYAPLSELITAVGRAPNDAALRERYFALLDQLGAEALALGQSASQLETLLHGLGAYLTQDAATLDALLGRTQDDIRTQNSKVQTIDGDTVSLTSQRNAAQADYDHAVAVAASTVSYAWIWPFGTIAAASVAAEYGQRATAAQNLVNQLNGQISAKNSERSAVQVTISALAKTVESLSAARELVRGGAPAVQKARGDVQAIRDDLGQLTKLVGTDLKKGLTSTRNILVSQALGKWKSLASSVAPFVPY